MSRIPLHPLPNMSPQQQALVDRILTGPRGELVGPLRAALHVPAIADKWEALGVALRYGQLLQLRQREIAIMLCGRYWNSAVEWYVHAEAARSAGVPLAAIQAIRDGGRLVLADALDRAVYEFTRTVLETGQVPDETYQTTLELLGVEALVELTSLVGYYVMVAVMLNAHHIPLPAHDGAPPWRLLPPASGFTPLPVAEAAA